MVKTKKNTRNLQVTGTKRYRYTRKNMPRNKKFLISRNLGVSSRAMAWHGSPFPEEMYTKFTYAENVTIPVTSGAVATRTFAMNGLYDPDVTGFSHSPRFYNTLLGANNTNAPYNAYCVYASKFEAICVATDAVDSVSMRAIVGVGGFLSTTSAPSSLAEMEARQDYAKKYLGYWDGGHDVAKVKKYCKVNKILGAKILDDKAGATASYNANPSNIAYWMATVVPVNETVSITYRFIVKITYYVKLYGRNDVQDS